MTSLAPLRHRSFRWLFLGRTISSLGSGVAPIALGFAVLDLTGSLAALGLVVAARSVANVAALLFGGVAADRWPRHLVLTGAQSLAAVAQGAMAVLVLTGNATVPLLAALGMVNGAAAGLGFPATSAMVPLTVPSDVLRQANALSRLGATTALIGGAATGGSLVALAGPGWGLAADAVSFAVAAVCFARIGVASVRASDSANSVLRDLREGWQEFRSRRWVVAVVAQYFVVNACLQGAIIVLGPAVADATFGRVGWGLALAALNLGLLVGGVLALRWQPAHALRWGVALCLATVLPVAALAGRAPLPLVAAALLLAGVAIEQFSVAWDVSLQQHVPPDRLARVYSYDALGSFAAIPVGEAATGMLAQAHGTEAVLLACATLIAAATLAALTSTSIRRLEVRRTNELAA
jgi:MFS family permease